MSLPPHNHGHRLHTHVERTDEPAADARPFLRHQPDPDRAAAAAPRELLLPSFARVMAGGMKDEREVLVPPAPQEPWATAPPACPKNSRFSFCAVDPVRVWGGDSRTGLMDEQGRRNDEWLCAVFHSFIRTSHPMTQIHQPQNCAVTCEDTVAASNANSGEAPVLKACNKMCYQRCECLADHLLLEVRSRGKGRRR